MYLANSEDILTTFFWAMKLSNVGKNGMVSIFKLLMVMESFFLISAIVCVLHCKILCGILEIFCLVHLEGKIHLPKSQFVHETLNLTKYCWGMFKFLNGVQIDELKHYLARAIALQCATTVCCVHFPFLCIK